MWSSVPERTSRPWFELLADWSADDPDPDGRAGVAGDRLHGYAQRISSLASIR